jgi:hypothetical protein
MIYSVDLFGQNEVNRRLLDNFNAFGSSFDSLYELLPVNGGVRTCHWGGAKVDHFGARALERVALI